MDSDPRQLTFTRSALARIYRDREREKTARIWAELVADSWRVLAGELPRDDRRRTAK